MIIHRVVLVRPEERLQEQQEDDAVTRKHVDGMRDLHDLVAVGTSQDIQNSPGTLDADGVETGHFEFFTLEQVGHGIEYRRSFAQHGNQIERQILGEITDQDPHQQFAEHGRKAELARGKAPDQRNEQDAGDAENNRRDRIAVRHVELDGCGGCWQQQQ